MSRLSTPAHLFVTAWAQIFFYGCNIILYGVGMYLLRRRRDRKGTMFHILSATLLLVFITIAAILTTVVTLAQLMSLTSPLDAASRDLAIIRVDLVTCTLINLVMLQVAHINAYVILFYRCYHIWNQSWKVLAVPLIITIAESILYWGFELPLYVHIPYAGGTNSEAYTKVLRKAKDIDMATVILAIAADTLLTILIAGRIWWVKRGLQQFELAKKGSGPRRYDRVIAITMESGIINPIGLITLLAFTRSNNDQATGILASLLPQIFAIAPLLITVRVGLGLTIEADHVATVQTAFSTGISFQETGPIYMSERAGGQPHRHVSVSSSQTGRIEENSEEENAVESNKKGYAL